MSADISHKLMVIAELITISVKLSNTILVVILFAVLVLALQYGSEHSTINVQYGEYF